MLPWNRVRHILKSVWVGLGGAPWPLAPRALPPAAAGSWPLPCTCLQLSPVCVIWAAQKIQELEATLYNALQQEPGGLAGEALSEDQREDLQAAVEKVRRQILRQSREFDSQILRSRLELLQQAQQVRPRPPPRLPRPRPRPRR